MSSLGTDCIPEITRPQEEQSVQRYKGSCDRNGSLQLGSTYIFNNITELTIMYTWRRKILQIKA